MAEISSRQKIFVGMSRKDYLAIEHGLSIPPEFESTDPVRIVVLNPQRDSTQYIESARRDASKRHGVPIEKLHLYREVVSVEQID